MEYKDVEYFEFRKQLVKGLSKEEYNCISSFPLSPAWTVEDYVECMKVKGRIKEEDNLLRLVAPEVWKIK